MRTFIFLVVVIGGIFAAFIAAIIIQAPPTPPRPPVSAVAQAARDKCLSDNFDALIALGVKPSNGYESAGRLCDDKGIYAPR